MKRITLLLTSTAAVLSLTPALASAHVSLHPNAIPQGSFITTNVRVPNEESNASITSVAIKLPTGVLDAEGEPPAGWTFRAKTKKLAKPVTTDDGTISTEVTEVIFSGGKTPPGEFVSLPLTLSIPDSAKQGDVVGFPTVQTYSNGKIVRWIGSPTSDQPAPTIDITAPGSATLDVTGGDAGPPAKLPANLAGPSSSAGAAPAATAVKKQSNGLAIAALVVGLLALAVGGVAITRKSAG
jgi:uncharacterized protein